MTERQKSLIERMETVTIYGGDAYGLGCEFDGNLTTDCTHRITFDLIDGEPDCDSIKMEKLQ
jgi:hypothetical protein